MASKYDILGLTTNWRQHRILSVKEPVGLSVSYLHEEVASVEFVPLQAGSASSSVRNAVRSRLDHSRPDERGNVAAGARRNFFIVFSPSSSSTSFFFECVV